MSQAPMKFFDKILEWDQLDIFGTDCKANDITNDPSTPNNCIVQNTMMPGNQARPKIVWHV